MKKITWYRFVSSAFKLAPHDEMMRNTKILGIASFCFQSQFHWIKFLIWLKFSSILVFYSLLLLLGLGDMLKLNGDLLYLFYDMILKLTFQLKSLYWCSKLGCWKLWNLFSFYCCYGWLVSSACWDWPLTGWELVEERAWEKLGELGDSAVQARFLNSSY